MFKINKISAMLSSAFKGIQFNFKGMQIGNDNTQINNFDLKYPQEIVIEKVEEELAILKKSRFLVGGMSSEQRAKALATKLTTGEFAGCASELKAKALAWCARMLAKESTTQASELLELAKQHTNLADVQIAKACILFADGNCSDAFPILSNLGTSQSNTAAFQLLVHHDNLQAAIDWLDSAGLEYTDLDADGKFVFLSYHIEEGNWPIVYDVIEGITVIEFDHTPILHYLVAIASLAKAVPEEGNPYLLNQIPVNLNWKLADDKIGLAARRTAILSLEKSAVAARKLGCEQSANHMTDYALWLKLLDEETKNNALLQLQDGIKNEKERLRLVPLAIQFGLKLDLTAIDAEIEQSIARNCKVLPEVAWARLATSMCGAPKDVAANISKYRHQFSGYFNTKYIDLIEIEALAQSGVGSIAAVRLNELEQEGLPKHEVTRLRHIISITAGDDPIIELRAQYDETGKLADLALLVERLQANYDWDELAKFAEILFNETRSCEDAICFATALYHRGDVDRLLRLVKDYSEFLEHDDKMVVFKAYALFVLGDVVEARNILENIKNQQNTQWINEIKMLIIVAAGDWESLPTLIDAEWSERQNRTAVMLMKVANMASAIGSSRTKELVKSAAAQDEDNPNILLAAYNIAIQDGWEDDELVNKWLNQAIKLSTTDGPIKSYTTREIADMQPNWAKQSEDTFDKLCKSEIPIIFAANDQNQSLVELFLLIMLANSEEKDVRKRALIPCYSGSRLPITNGLEKIKTVALDATALLTLAYLDLIDLTINTFEEVFIPHSTMQWLLSEQKKVRFHQPSRVENAKLLRRLIQNKQLNEFCFEGVPDTNLVNEVGLDLAEMISLAASRIQLNSNSQHLVIALYPVRKFSSFLDETADLSQYNGLLCSCRAIVTKVYEEGLITKSDFQSAVSYLKLRENDWPKQVEVQNDATLYLDGIAVTYLRQVGVLDKLVKVGLKVYVARDKLQESDALIEREHFVGKVAGIIDRLRKELAAAITNGKVKLGRQDVIASDENAEVLGHPAITAISFVNKVDAVFIDDRFFNKQLDSNVLSTQDLLQIFKQRKTVNLQQYVEYQTKLRNAGCGFIPVSEEELVHALGEATFRNGKLVEFAELKAIRESILKVRMSKYFQRPAEGSWLGRMMLVIGTQIKNLWKSTTDVDEVIVKANWLLKLFDMRGWSNGLDSGMAAELIDEQYVNQTTVLSLAPVDANEEQRGAYWSWLDDVLLSVIESDNSLFMQVIERVKSVIYSSVEREPETRLALESKAPDYSPAKIKYILVQSALNMFAPKLQSRLLADPLFRVRLDIAVTSKFTVDSNIVFDSNEFIRAVSKIYGNKRTNVKLIDDNHKRWFLRYKNDGLLLTSNSERLKLDNFAECSPVKSERLDCFENRAKLYNLSNTLQNKWRKLIETRALRHQENDEYYKDISNTVVFVTEAIRDELQNGTYTVTTFIPNSLEYYKGLAGITETTEEINIQNFVAIEFRNHCESLVKWKPLEGALQALKLCSHLFMSDEFQKVIITLPVDVIEDIYQNTANYGDRMSQLAAVEIGFSLIPTIPAIESSLIEIIKQIVADDPDKPQSEIKLLSSWIVLVESLFEKDRTLSKVPLFMRKMSCIAQASIITQSFIKFNVDIDVLSKQLINRAGNYHVLQGLINLRKTPRWLPENIAPKSLKEHFIHRIDYAVHRYGKDNLSCDLRDAISLSGPPILITSGIVDGNASSVIKLPPELRQALFEQLEQDNTDVKTFMPLINFGIVYELDKSDTDKIVNWLKANQHQFKDFDTEQEEVALLLGLANLAASTRSIDLEIELRGFVRRQRRRPGAKLTLDNMLRISLLAAAAHSELNDWCECVGEWLTELSFSDLTADEVAGLHDVIIKLCKLEPQLWVTLGRAEAALQAA